MIAQDWLPYVISEVRQSKAQARAKEIGVMSDDICASDDTPGKALQLSSSPDGRIVKLVLIT